ncbi:MAG: RNA 3'-terminal phosphate cyclase [Nanoarchaeota archaeon]|nr:RNA 3'-terminal phosphate cyclase [Nanoarchaeota archaeon]MBU1976451.1 RNA 3'-terminal phosphate cyclase [Nanoarchaeota archaeon]
MIELDGSYGEGGGALTRTALALSVLTGKEFRVDKIRSGRPNPGLKPQHLTAINALKEICNAKTNEIQIGSTELHFQPGKVNKGTYNIDIGTAGSITLLLQALILPCLFASGKVTLNIKGGTCGKWQASVDYLQNLLIPYLQRFVEKIELKILKRGYYPKGEGQIVVEISPRFKLKDYEDLDGLREELQLKTPKIILTEQGILEQIRGVVNVSSELQEKEVGERIKRSAEGSLKEYPVPKNIRVDYAKTLSVGGEILLWGIFSKDGLVDFDNPLMLSGDALVEKGKSSEDIGKEAAEKLKEEINSSAAVDFHLADQLISSMSLLPGSEILISKITDHTLTNIYVVEKFLNVGFKIDDNKISVEKM